MSAKWGSSLTMQFIQEYKRQQCLWNSESPEYKNRDVRYRAYKSIAKFMKIPGFGVPEVKNKIKNLRSTFCQEKKKIAEFKKIGSVYIPNISWYEEMKPIMNHSNITGNFFVKAEEDVKFLRESEESTFEEYEVVVSPNDTAYSPRPTPTKIRPVKSTKHKSKGMKRASIVSHVSVNEDLSRNQFDIFGSSIAAQLKVLPYDKALIAQSKIQTLLSNIAIENMRSNNASSSTAQEVLSSSMTPNHDTDSHSDIEVHESKDLLVNVISNSIDNDL